LWRQLDHRFIVVDGLALVLILPALLQLINELVHGGHSVVELVLEAMVEHILEVV